MRYKNVFFLLENHRPEIQKPNSSWGTSRWSWTKIFTGFHTLAKSMKTCKYFGPTPSGSAPTRIRFLGLGDSLVKKNILISGTPYMPYCFFKSEGNRRSGDGASFFHWRIELQNQPLIYFGKKVYFLKYSLNVLYAPTWEARCWRRSRWSSGSISGFLGRSMCWRRSRLTFTQIC